MKLPIRLLTKEDFTFNRSDRWIVGSFATVIGLGLFSIWHTLAIPDQYKMTVPDTSLWQQIIPAALIVCGILSFFLVRRQMRSIQVANQLYKTLEQERILHLKSEKFSALADMAGGLAHEINNPLAIIMGHAQSLKFKAQKGNLKPEEISSSLEKIEETAKRISKIINKLRMFSESENQEVYLVKIEVILDDIKSFWGEKLHSHNVDLTIEPFDKELTIFCKPVDLVLVFLNLISNSYGAIKSDSNKWIRIQTLAFQDHVEIRVIDSGRGIPQEIRDKIFQPFFTTKTVGEGSGLGLNVASGILKTQNGTLTLDTSVDNTCFVVSIPRHASTEKLAA